MASTILPPPTLIQAPSGNHGGRFAQKPTIAVMHYTASASAEPAIAWLRTPASEASAHVVISPDGTITQLVPFDTVAWHAGKSALRDLRGLNAYAWGIELVNAGPCQRVNGTWYAGGRPVPQPVMSKHKSGGPWIAWAPYTEAQLEAATLVVSMLGAREIVGHDDIALGRKFDPGPAFDWFSFCARMNAREPGWSLASPGLVYDGPKTD